MTTKKNFEEWPLDKFIEYDRNPRRHDHVVDRISAAIHEYGFRVPIVAKSDGTIVDGHLRLKAAKKLKLGKVPVMLADDMTDAQIKAFRISVNRMAELAEWDDELLRLEFDELVDLGYDLELTGFTADEIYDGFVVDEVGMPELPDGDKDPYQQKTFTLHDEQAAIVDDAVTLARTNPLSDTGLNENTNGNALALICEQWLKVNG